MTNEEFRLNCYCKNCKNYDEGCDWLCRGIICNEADAYESALNEKNRQFREYLEKMREKYIQKCQECNDISQYTIREYYSTRVGIFNEIINELFKEN